MTTRSSTSDAFVRKMLATSLDAAWMRRCGPSGTPGKWWVPGEFLEIFDGEVGVDVYPIYAVVGEGGRVKGWSAHLDPQREGVVEAWEWRFGIGWDDCTPEEVSALEDLGGCFDDRYVDFFVLGSHSEQPPLSDEVVEAFAYVRDES